MELVLSLLLGAVLVVFWFDSMRARESAVAVARDCCARAGLQFLDETVALRRLGLGRLHGTLRLRRKYRFEFTDTGAVRRRGHVVFVGREVEDIYLALGGNDDGAPPAAAVAHLDRQRTREEHGQPTQH